MTYRFYQTDLEATVVCTNAWRFEFLTDPLFYQREIFHLEKPRAISNRARLGARFQPKWKESEPFKDAAYGLPDRKGILL